MCGITGLYAYNEIGRFHAVKLNQALQTLSKRGPDRQNTDLHYFVHLGHTRLAIIDLNPQANQPMKDESGRYTIVFNGEIFNFKALRRELENQGISFFSNSDTEVLLKGFIAEKEQFLPKLNGFFAFAIYDQQTEELFLARDRYGVKPLLIYEDEDKFIFASEMKAILSYGIPKELDWVSVAQYFQFNYIPQPYSILKNVRKLPAGTWLKVKKREQKTEKYYQIPMVNPAENLISYLEAQRKFVQLLTDAVERRLVADVPLGCFLSGGIDSSVVTALASQFVPQLNTFSIGYRDEPFFDETHYAQLVAKKFKTNHTVFSLSNQDLLESLEGMLAYLDEPFADSSALAVYILSLHTRKKVTVALSGDGADEMLGGYNKHAAELRARQRNWKTQLVQTFSPIWKSLPQSRNNPLTNKIRQLNRFAEGVKLTPTERYWQWAGFLPENELLTLFHPKAQAQIDQAIYQQRKHEILQYLTPEGDLNQVFYTDMHLVLQGDMLTKIDLMSMANSLEIRNPFLDFQVVNFVFSLPVEYKITPHIRKRILQESFRDLLPAELFKRPKHGFEVPLLKWFRKELKSLLFDDLLADKFIEEQQIFQLDTLKTFKKKLFSNNPQDVHAHLWALLVFQTWYKRYFLK
ncbi:MAG: asparagine synthase (glutamine-hydrolyzing) [Microscillaceae bacterium]|nr:asparagine synthase (glutamine-hydrolyzing) [Microscillaceae bacterium]MDW8461381.1 asparagine synthase (glutamine-hydrolyzing) [Cytophagales bacterium]